MNETPKPLLAGTYGELLVQLRLLQHGVQTAPPIKDTGNDLIAIRGGEFRALQVKTKLHSYPVKFDRSKLFFHNVKTQRVRHFHLLALVILPEKISYDDLVDFELRLDECVIYLLARKQITKGNFKKSELAPFKLSTKRIDQLFPRPKAPLPGVI